MKERGLRSPGVRVGEDSGLPQQPLEEEEAPMGREYVGIDFHRRRSVVVRISPRGKRLSVVRIDNRPAALAEAVTAAGDRPQVVLEATYGWYWAVDVLQELGATVHLANPNALNWGERRVKNDVVDATDLADMLRLGRLPEAWIAPPAVRELRELVRYRAKLVQLRSGLKAQVHAVMAKEGCAADGGRHVRAGRSGPARRDGSGPQLHDPGRVAARSDRDLRPRDRDARAATSTARCVTTAAIRRCRRSTGSGARSPPSWSPRSVTSPGSRHHAICARGPG